MVYESGVNKAVIKNRTRQLYFKNEDKRQSQINTENSLLVGLPCKKYYKKLLRLKERDTKQ